MIIESTVTNGRGYHTDHSKIIGSVEAEGDLNLYLLRMDARIAHSEYKIALSRNHQK